MGIGIVITPEPGDAERLRAAIERLSSVGRNARVPLGRTGLFVRREAQRSLRARRHDWGPSTSKLSKSLAMEVGPNYAVVGSNLVYAAIQQLGGTVTPRGHKYLALPALGHLRRAGVWPRDLPKDSMRFERAAAIKIGSHSWIGPALVRAKDTEVEHSFQGAGKKGGEKKAGHKRKAGEVMFALVRKVTIRGRPYLTFSPAAREFMLAEFERAYTRAVGKG
jgi:phage gpG-like protein